jgi:hypothetical protein
MEGEIVRRRQWLPADGFLDLLGLTNLIGPNSTELAMALGHRRWLAEARRPVVHRRPRLTGALAGRGPVRDAARRPAIPNRARTAVVGRLRGPDAARAIVTDARKLVGDRRAAPPSRVNKSPCCSVGRAWADRLPQAHEGHRHDAHEHEHDDEHEGSTDGSSRAIPAASSSQRWS